MHVARIPLRIRARLCDERGFTLIELLVALLAGVIVSGATLAILIVSLHLTSNYNDRVDANQQGRLAMDRITQALNSSCINPLVTPVLAGSTADTLMFYSSQTDTPLITPNEVTISTAATTAAPAALTMTTYPLSGTTNNWTTTGTQTNFTLVAWVAPTVVGVTTKSFFQYYQYASDKTPTLEIVPGTGGLTAAQASQVVAVVINFQALPSDNWNAAGRAANFTTESVLRLTPASSASSASNSPCA